MKKFYFQTDEFIRLESQKCDFTGEKILSIGCVICVNNKGFDKEENYVKCMLYDKVIMNNELLKSYHNLANKLKLKIDEVKELKEQNSHLQLQLKKGSA